MKKAITNLKNILINDGWTNHGLYSLKSPNYENTTTFIADVYNEYHIKLYVNRSSIAQNGQYICEFTSKRKLITFLNLMKNL